MKKILLLLGVCLVLGGLWWSFRPQGLPPRDLDRSAPIRSALLQGREITIVAMGDSITAGVSARYSYIKKVERSLAALFPGSRVRGVNSGVPGDTAEGGLRRVKRDVLSHDPDLVLVEFGWNDLKDGHSQERFEKALRGIVEEIRRGSKALVYLMTATHIDVVVSAWQIGPRNDLIRQLARELDCGLIDLDLHFSTAKKEGVPIGELLSMDRIHPSEKGQDLIATAVLRELVVVD